MRTITRKDILLSLDLLGIVPGDTILMHSALTAIGPVEGGVDTVIDAFLEAVGPEGTLCMSSLTGWSAPFDAATTPTGVGYIAETFRKRPGTLRSLHPVHSIIAAGKNAAYITEGHEKCATGCGEGTPYLKIRDLGGKIVLLGVDEDRNTSLHCLEELSDSEYLVTLTIPAPTYLPGTETFTLTKFPPGHRNFKGITPAMRRDGIVREVPLGRAVVRCMDMPKLFAWGLDNLARDPYFFLCKNESCAFCAPVRAGKKGEPDE